MTNYNFGDYVSLTGKPSSATISPVSNTATLRSALSYGTQTIVRPGGYWQLSMTWQNIYGDKLYELQALLTLLNGGEHTIGFAAADWGKTVRGAYTGSPVVDGGSQSGNSLAIRGASTGVTGYFRAGDFFRIGTLDQLVMVTEDADTDGSGDATVSIWPELRGSPADGTAIGIGRGGEFRLTDVVEFQHNARSMTVGGDHISAITASFVDTFAGY